MDFRIFTEPQQGATYDDQLRVAKATEELGFDAFFRSDHYLVMGDGDGLPGPTDAWTTLAGLARETSRIRLGTLVSSVTYRYPGLLAIQVAQVDQMSGGRAELGLGTGWYEAEHRAYGLPFPERRFGMLEEQLQVVTGLWSTPLGQTYEFRGEHYTLEESPALPKPVQERIPIIVGGGGPRRTPAIAAEFASEYNSGFATLDANAERVARVRAACETIGRDPSTLILSAAATAAVGRSEEESAGRAERAGASLGRLRESGFAGSPSEVVDRIGALADLGFTRIYFQVMDMHDLDQLELLACEVVPQLVRS